MVKSGGLILSEDLFQQSRKPTGFRLPGRSEILSNFPYKNSKFRFILVRFFHLTNPLGYPLYQATARAAYLSEPANSLRAEAMTCNAIFRGRQRNRLRGHQGKTSGAGG